MSAYNGSSPFDQSVEKATADTPGDADWGIILEICDKAGQTTTGSKDCLKSVMKRLSNSSKNVQLKAITLLDSCVQNCGSPFHKEVATPEFVHESRAFLQKASPNVTDKFKENLKKWAEAEFKSDSVLSVIPTFYQALRSEGAYFGMGGGSSGTTKLSTSITSPASTTSGGSDADLEKAIALSLKESQTKSQTTSLYPQMSQLNSQYSAAPVQPSPSAAPVSAPQQPVGRQVRALYDFEAVEDNELTFRTGELITVLDDSDPNWWKGSTWRGEGLFPVNFASTDISMENSSEPLPKKSVQFDEEVQVEQFDPDSVQIDETVIDQALDEIQNADPTGLTEDSPEMLHLEEECKVMGPLIDQELERIDAKHNELMTLNQKLTDAFQLYTRLMKDAANVPQYSAPVSYMQQQPQQSTLPANYLHQQPAAAPAPMYASYNPHQKPAAQTQSYYDAGAYGGIAQAPPVMAQPQIQDQQPQFNQAAMLQQYQMGGTGLSNLQYIPTTGGPGVDGLQPGYNNTSQTSYHQQMQPPQQML